MAEFVQQSIEEMLPELQQMERVGLFTTEETRQILKRRKRYEYKLRRRTKCKEDFLQYIQYEINALGLVKLRRQKTGYTFKKLEIDIAMVHRIHQLFKLVTIRFKDDVKLWLSHIEFSKQRNEKATVSRLFTDMLQIHNKKPGLWITAAKWEFEDNANPDNARSLLQRGIRFNSESKHLWLEYYRMELLFTEKMRKRREILGVSMEEESNDVTDAVLDGSIANVVYQQAIGAITDDIEFILAFIPICQLFNFTQNQEDGIFEHLKQRFPQSELTWSAIAKRCLNSREQSNGKKLSKKQKSERVEEHEDKCYKVFDEAVEKLQTELMWTEYLAVCLERLHLKRSPSLHQKRLQKTLDVFKRASNASLLSSGLFIRWLELLDSCEEIEEAECVSEEATVRFPSNVCLWKCRLSLVTRTLADENQVLQVLNKARKSVIERESWPLWEITLQYLISINSISTEKQFKICTSSPVRELCIPAKYLYLQWVIATQGIHRAREVYHSLIKVKPVSVEFYQAFIDIERSQATPKIKKIRKVFEDALLDFGSDNTDLWLDYIKLETTDPKGRTENAGNLHFRAMKTLGGENVERFVTQYTLLQAGHEV